MPPSPYAQLEQPEASSEQQEPQQESLPEPQTEPLQEPSDGPPRKRPGRRLPLLVLGALAAAAAWWFMGPSGSPIDRDLVFLPNEPVVIVHAKVTELENCELLAEFKKLAESMGAGQFAGNSAPQLKELKGCLDTITFGVSSPGSSRDPDDAVACGVIRCTRDLLLNDMNLAQFGTEPITEEASDERSIISFQGAAYCQIDPRTIAIGNLKGVRAVLSRGLESATLSDQMSNALSQSDLSHSLTVVAAVPVESLDQAQPFLGFAPPEAVVITANVDQDIHLAASLVMQNESDIEALQTRAQPFLEMAKLQSPDAAKLVDTLQFSSSGTMLVVSATIPGAPLVEMVKGQASALVSQFARSAMPTFSETPPRQKKRLPRGAAEMCQQNLAMLNSAVERYYFDVGEWPASVADLGAYVTGDVPHFCPTHQVAYAIDPNTHRVTDSDVSAAAPVHSGSTAASAPESAGILAGIAAGPAMASLKAESPQEAFEGVAQAAKEGGVDRLLTGFTEAGRQAIAADLADAAQQDVATHSHRSPEVAIEFRDLQMKHSPEFQARDDSSVSRTQLAYLRHIAAFLNQHQIEFTGLAEMYAPCVLGGVVTQDDWAIGSVKYDKDGVVREVTLGFLKESGQWRICILDEIPSHVLESLEGLLNSVVGVDEL